MILLADESVDRQIVDGLREDGHTVLYVTEMDPGISDDAVLSLANEKKALLLTADRDFGELIFRQRKVSSGIIFIRLAGLTPSSKAEKVSLAVKRHSNDIQSAFSVITPSTIRIRKPA